MEGMVNSQDQGWMDINLDTLDTRILLKLECFTLSLWSIVQGTYLFSGLAGNMVLSQLLRTVLFYLHHMEYKAFEGMKPLA